MADLEDIDNTAPADSLFGGAVKINLIRTRLDGLYTILGDITAAEANQVENLGTTTISATQWGYLGALDQSIISTASVDFGEVDITKTTTLAAGGFGLRSQVTHSATGMTGTLRGAYIVATNAPFTATGTIRGAEIKSRAATSGDVGGNVTTLEGVSISCDAKNKTVTTQRGMEVILDGKSGAAVTTGVGIRIANNYQANIATTSYALQIYKDSFDYTADIQLSGGGLIGGSTGKILMDSSGVTSLTASANLDIGSYNFRAATLTADGLTSGRVVFASTSGLLTDDSDFTFATDTLTVTKIAAFTLMGKLTAGAVEIEGSAFDINGGTIDGITDLAVADGGTGSSTAGAARTALGVAIGSDVLAYDAGLSNLAGIAMAADKFYYTSADNTHVAGTVTAFGRSIIDDADEATFKATVNLEIGTDVLAQQTIGIANDNLMEVDDADAADNDYAKFTANGLEGRSYGEVRTDINVENGATADQTEAEILTLLGVTSAEIDQVGNINTTTISAAQWDWLGGYAINAKARAYLSANESGHTTSTTTRIDLNAETFDPGSNFDISTLASGTADGTSANHLIDSGYDFAAAGVRVGMRIKNTTDTTYAFIAAVAVGDLTLSADIFVDTEGWEVKNSKFTVPMAGYYIVTGSVYLSPVVADKRFGTIVKKNGTAEIFYVNQQTSNVDVASIGISDIISLDADDYLELWLWHNFGVDATVKGQQAGTFLSVHFLSNA